MFTTLRALKWAHNLGIKQERVRIASHLQLRAQGQRAITNVMNDMLADEMRKKRPNKRAIERLEFDRAVARQVDEIIEELFNPKGEYVATSLMFPEVEDNK